MVKNSLIYMLLKNLKNKKNIMQPKIKNTTNKMIDFNMFFFFFKY